MGKHTKNDIYFFRSSFPWGRDKRRLNTKVAAIIESMKIPVPKSMFSIVSLPIWFLIKWFIHEPDGAPTLDSPSLFFLEAAVVNLFRFILKLKLLPSWRKLPDSKYIEQERCQLGVFGFTAT